MYERFTDRARKVMQLANQEAQRFNHEYIGTEHILLGLVKEGSGVGANVLKNLDVDLRTIRREVERIVQAGPDTVTVGKLPQTPRAKKVIEYSIEEARNLNHDYVGTEHLLLGLVREQEGVGAQVLINLGLTLELVREEVLNLLGHHMETGELGGERQAQKGKSKTPALDSFGRDLTELARQGKLELSVGHETEGERVLEALQCRTWNRLLLISNSAPTILGVVQTAACRLVASDSAGLPQRRLLAVHPCSFLGGGGAKARERLLAVLNEARRAKDVILFLDDLHLLAQCEPDVGLAGTVQASLLIGYHQPLLAAATPEGFQQFLAPCHGLTSLFDTLVLEPPDRAHTLEILRRLRPRYETHHRVAISDEALAAATEAAGTLPTTRPLADWATLLLDRACARLRMRTPQPERSSLQETIAALIQQKNHAVAAQDFERAAQLHDQAERLKQQASTESRSGSEPNLTPELIQEIAREVGGPLPSAT